MKAVLRGMCTLWGAVLPGIALAAAEAAPTLSVPAFTAYFSPDPHGARSGRDGVSGWNDPALKVLWFGEFKTTGTLDCAVSLRLPADARSRLRLTVAGQSCDADVQGGAGEVTAKFGTFVIPVPGYQRFSLESLNAAGRPFGDPAALLLAGPALKDAHFNLKPRRNSASVHLSYAVPPRTQVAAFYCEVTGVDEPLSTYYMACGWDRGYFGMQINGPSERRIIFSVWDSGSEAVDRRKVADADRTKLVAKGEGVQAGDFGNEGTGGHSHLVYPWKTGERQRFVVTCQSNDTPHTTFAGYWFHPEQKKWMLISSWKAPLAGGLHGLYSFVEDFDGSTGHLRRKALFGSQWVRTTAGDWVEITTATFSHDETGEKDRLDRFMGIEDGRFFLSNGGFGPGHTKYGTPFTRPATGTPPELELPDVSR